MAYRQQRQGGVISFLIGEVGIAELLGDKGSRKIALGEFLIGQTSNQEIAIGARAEQRRLGQRLNHQLARRLAGRAGGDEFGNHRVIKGRDFLPADNAGVIAHAVLLQLLKARNRAGARQKALGRVFRIKPHLDGMARKRYIVLGQPQRVAFRHFDL